MTEMTFAQWWDTRTVWDLVLHCVALAALCGAMIDSGRVAALERKSEDRQGR